MLQVVATIPEAHSRPAYRLVQPAPSPWVDPGRDAYQLFASLAQDGTCRLWDLRCCQAVRTLTGIGNSQVGTSCAQVMGPGLLSSVQASLAIQLWKGVRGVPLPA